nr:hypothetical protein GCM10010200_024100 [Actinomadura rugatobispora]
MRTSLANPRRTRIDAWPRPRTATDDAPHTDRSADHGAHVPEARRAEG